MLTFNVYRLLGTFLVKGNEYIILERGIPLKEFVISYPDLRDRALRLPDSLERLLSSKGLLIDIKLEFLKV